MTTKTSTIAVTIRLFARYREVVGAGSLDLSLERDATVGDLAREMLRRYPALVRDASRLVVAVNQEYTEHGHILGDGDEVALIPPVSGGENHIVITDQPIDPATFTNMVKAPQHGAVVTFLGNTRDHNEGRTVLHLEYEAYRPMADAKLAEVAAEMKAKWPIGEVAIAHRVGRVDIGETSLVVAVGAGHRREAFDAALYAVDRIKQIVPIWKKEFFKGGEVWIGSQDGAGSFSQA
ncbi:MAG: molybdopterin converting factor subunit 1 [SAR202 cluster bacterium]|nr:molybdopterin converting factor subunit 1 [SAR202 cluster bacterium]